MPYSAIRRSYRHFALILTAMLAPAAVFAGDYQITASGPLASYSSDSADFDGTTTTTGTLPPVLAGDRLAGGSFRATYRFSTVTPATGTSTSYTQTAPSGLTFELLDASGNIVHQGVVPQTAGIYVANNYGSPPYSVDQVFLDSTFSGITGAAFPSSSIYGQQPRVLDASLSVFDYVNGTTNYLNDLGIPIDAATYLSFPNRVFDVLAEFDDGDVANQVEPYRYVGDVAEYNITSLTVTPGVPEPTSIAVLAGVGTMLLSRPSRSTGRR